MPSRQHGSFSEVPADLCTEMLELLAPVLRSYASAPGSVLGGRPPRFRGNVLSCLPSPRRPVAALDEGPVSVRLQSVAAALCATPPGPGDLIQRRTCPAAALARRSSRPTAESARPGRGRVQQAPGDQGVWMLSADHPLLNRQQGRQLSAPRASPLPGPDREAARAVRVWGARRRTPLADRQQRCQLVAGPGRVPSLPGPDREVAARGQGVGCSAPDTRSRCVSRAAS